MQLNLDLVGRGGKRRDHFPLPRITLGELQEGEEKRTKLREVAAGGGVTYLHIRVMGRKLRGRMEDKWRSRRVKILLFWVH